MQALGKLLSHAPEFLLDSYVIWLAVPDTEQELAKKIFALPEEDGGLSDDQGMEIIEISSTRTMTRSTVFFASASAIFVVAWIKTLRRQRRLADRSARGLYRPSLRNHRRILNWPWKRFDAFYSAFMKRKLTETLERRKEMMIAALWANLASRVRWRNARREAIEELEEHYDNAVENILLGTDKNKK